MVLVTGASGFVGRHLVDALASVGVQVRALSRRAAPTAPQVGVDWATGDLTDSTRLPRLFIGVTHVVHLANEVDADPSRLHDLNVVATGRLARAARDAGVRRFVHVSSASVYGDGTTTAPHRESDPPTPQWSYGESKRDGEAAVREALRGDVEWLILRPTLVFGVDSRSTRRFVAELRSRRVRLSGPVRAIEQPVLVHDLVSALVEAVRRPRPCSGVVNIGGERPMAFTDWVAMWNDALGHRALALEAPGWVIPLSGWFDRAGLPGPWRRLARPVINHSVDIALAADLLGFSPTLYARAIPPIAAALGRLDE